MIIQGKSLDGSSVLRADYCVVGSGMGGSAAAHKLASAGRDVLVVEAGNTAEAAAHPAAVTAEQTGRPFGLPVTRCIELGGTSNAWHGVCTPLEEIDFEPRPWLSDSGWPIRRRDLDAFYAEGARLFGHEQLSGLQPNRMPSAVQHALRDFEFDHSILLPKLLEYRTPPFRWKKTLLGLARSGKLRCLLDTVALELIPSENGSQIESLKAATLGGVVRIHAKVFIIAAGALETPRLLLNSRSRHPKGIGNNHDLVGRHLMDHLTGPFAMLHFKSPLRAPAYSGLPLAKGDRYLMTALTLRPERQRSHAVPNNYFVIRPNVAGHHIEHDLRLSFLASRGVRDFTPRQVAGILTTPNLLYRILVQKFKVPARYRYGELFYFAEQIPNRDSCVSLSREMRDASGYPIASIHWQPIARDSRSLLDFARAVFSRGLNSSQYAPAANGFAGDWMNQFTSAGHHLGTARMAADPARGVVNANLQVFGIHNLYLCDGSVFATSGSADPALTITALALRLGGYLLGKSAHA